MEIPILNTDELSDASQEDRIEYINQIILDLMDYTEQSDDEKVWCELNEKFRELITKYHYKLIGFNMPLPPPIYEKDIQK